MNVYFETNFVQELVFLQEQAKSCEKILSLGESGAINLVIPAFSLAEPLEKLHRQKSTRQNIQKSLDSEIRQLSRTSGYEARIQAIKSLDLLFAQSIDDEWRRFEAYRKRILDAATIIPLDEDILLKSQESEALLNLSAQDAIVYASVLISLNSDSAESCFLNRNSKDFDIPEIRAELETYKCRMIPRFDDGLRYVESRLLNP